MISWSPIFSPEGDDHPVEVCESVTLAHTPFPNITYKLKNRPDIELSNLQRETVRVAINALQTYHVFALGDGTGVGKGRMIAGVIFEWLATYPDSRVVWFSANQRLKKQSYEELELMGLSVHDERILFKSYIANSRFESNKEVKDHLREESNPLLICDECHLLRKQRALFEHLYKLTTMRPDISIMYSSATMMSDPNHLLYLSHKFRIHSSRDAPFKDSLVLKEKLSSGGNAIMELVSMFLRSNGLFMCRQLSLNDVSVENITIDMSVEDKKKYSAVTKVLIEKNVNILTSQRLLMNLLTSFKIKKSIEMANKELSEGNFVIFIFTYTGEAAMERCIRKHQSRPSSRLYDAIEEYDDSSDNRHTDILSKNELDPIDQLIDYYGNKAVAEITGRSRRFVRSNNGWSIERINRTNELNEFQNGEKRIAILSRAGGIGLSLHDNGHGKRVNFVIELPWSSEDFVQIIGRSHRAASITPPSYYLMTMNLPSETRIAYSLSKRVQCMGALSRGNRSACDVLNLGETFGSTTSVQTRRTFCLKLIISKVIQQEMFHMPVERVLDEYKKQINHFARSNGMHRLHASTVSERAMARLMMENLNILPHPPFVNEDDPIMNAFGFSTRYMYAIAMVQTFKDSLLTGIVKWSPDNHYRFGNKTKDFVSTIMLAHSHIDTHNTLGILPDSVLFYILELAIWEGDSIGKVLSHWQSEVPLKKWKSICSSHENFLNNVMLMDADTQNAASIVMAQCKENEISHLKKNKSIREDNNCIDICTFIENRVGKGIRASIKNVENVSSGTYKVYIHFNVILSNNPPKDAKYWKNIRSGVLCWTVNDSNVGNTMDTTTHVDEYSHVRIPELAWKNSVSRRNNFLQEKCKKIKNKYYVATYNALYNWDDSMKRIVKIDSESMMRPIVGLLVKVE